MSDSSCTLSASASAFSSLLTALIGSVINGLTSGWFVAFMTGWIAWFALFRVLLGGVYMLWRGVTASWVPEDDRGQYHGRVDGQANAHASQHTTSGSYEPLHDDDAGSMAMRSFPQAYHTPHAQSLTGYDALSSETSTNTTSNTHPPARPIETLTGRPKIGLWGWLWPRRSEILALQHFQRSNSSNTASAFTGPWPPLDRRVTAFGWLGWTYGALIAPITLMLWTAANFGNSNAGPAKIVKGLTVAVSALPLCIDCKTRFGAALRRRTGVVWMSYAFDLTNSLSCLLQGGISAALLITGVLQTNAALDSNPDYPSGSGIPLPFVGIYPIFCLIWMAASLRILPLRDGARGPSNIILNFLVGAFAGLALAAPAFALWQNASFDEKYGGDGGGGSSSLADYLSCETQAWRRFAAVAP